MINRVLEEILDKLTVKLNYLTSQNNRKIKG